MDSVLVLGETDASTAVWAVVTEAVDFVASDLVQLQKAELVLLVDVWLDLWSLLRLLLSLLILTSTINWSNGNDSGVLWKAHEGLFGLQELTAEIDGGDAEELSEVLNDGGWVDFLCLCVVCILNKEFHQHQKKWCGICGVCFSQIPRCRFSH